MAEHLTGLIAAPHTPMNADGSLKLDVVERQAQSLADNGVRGAFVCGSTGEGLSLTSQERRSLLERWKEVAADDLDVLVHVGHHSAAEAKALAAHAERAGVRAIACMGPSYLKPARIEDLVAFCSDVASAAPATAFYYYHQPGLSGLPFSGRQFLEAACGKIATFAGLKYSHNDIVDFAHCVAFEGGRYDMLFGRDEDLLSALAVGAGGAIGSTYNFAAPLYRRMIEAYEAAHMVTAQKEMAKAREMVHVLERYGGWGAIKASMRAIGIDCGPCRLPLRSLSQERYEQFYEELERIGFFAYCSKVSGPAEQSD